MSADKAYSNGSANDFNAAISYASAELNITSAFSGTERYAVSHPARICLIENWLFSI
jgi:hypothetical protein